MAKKDRYNFINGIFYTEADKKSHEIKFKVNFLTRHTNLSTLRICEK